MKEVPYWLDTAPPLQTRSPSAPSENTDFVVVGGGLTGVSASLTLANRGASVVLLEANGIGSGASGRNGGMSTTGLTIGFGLAVRRYGEETASRLYKSYNDAIDFVESLIAAQGIQCAWERTGRLSLASKPAHYAGFEETNQALRDVVGQQTVLVPKNQLQDEVGSDVYHGGLVDPLGAGLHVGQLVYGLAAAAEHAGAEIHEENRAISIQRAGVEGFAVETSRGRVRARRVLIATNAYADQTVPWVRRRIAAVGSYVIVTEPLSESLCNELLPTRRMASDSLNLLYYFRITPDNRLLFGGRARFAVPGPESDPKSVGILIGGMRRVFPQTSDVRVDYSWGGLVGFSLDRMPHAGERDGLFYATAYGGHGVPMATYMGSQMAKLMLGDDADNPWSGLPFRAIPGHFGPPWFLPFAGAYYRLKDLVA